MGYGVFLFRSNGWKIQHSNGLYFGTQTSDFFRSNVLSKCSNVLRRLQHIKVCRKLDIPFLIYFINRYNIVTTDLHNAEKKILDLKEENKDQKRQNGDISEIVKKLVQAKVELENQLR